MKAYLAYGVNARVPFGLVAQVDLVALVGETGLLERYISLQNVSRSVVAGARSKRTRWANGQICKASQQLEQSHASPTYD